MLSKTTDDGGSRSAVARTELDHGNQIPRFNPEGVRIIHGRAVISTEPALEHEKLLNSLRGMDRITVRKLFHTLSPPPMDSLVGEYDAELLKQGGPISQLITRRMFSMYGTWIGKAFRSVSENTGVGYNYFQSGDTIVRKLRMNTTIEKSTLDDGASLIISYKAHNRGLISWLIGEVRQVTPHVMLGIGIFGPALGQRDVSRRKIPFVLVGPRRSYQHE